MNAFPKLSALETQCVASFAGLNEGYCLNFKAVAVRSGIERQLVRRVVRACARKGLLAYERGLTNDEGEVAGSGYGLTAEGRNWLKEHAA